MTKESSKFAKKISTRIKNVEQIRDLLVIRPTEHIVRGFLFDRTPIKDEFYAWAFIVPLFCPYMKNFSLNYSYRICSNNNIPMMVNVNCNEESISSLCEILEQEKVTYLSTIFDPRAFLHELEPANMNLRVNMDLDFAIAHCITGDFETGKASLQTLLESKSTSPILPRVQASAKSILDSLEGDHAMFWDLVDSFEKENVRLHFPGLTRQSSDSLMD
jgi:hypothetical protein